MTIRRMMGLLGLTLALGAAAGVWATQGSSPYDQWAEYFGLEGNAAHENADPDNDTVVNSGEYARNLDPTSNDTDGDLLADGGESNALSRVFLKLGDPRFSQADGLFEYCLPAWSLGVRQTDGQWITNAPLNGQNTTAWHVAASVGPGTGSVELAIDRTLITTSDLTLAVGFFDHAGSELIVELADTNLATVAGDLFGNLATGSGAPRSVTVTVPLQLYQEAAVIRLRRLGGECTVYVIQAYRDTDGDLLDDEGEQEFGGDPTKIDRDGDGLSDYEEVMRYKTNPALADTDGDGISDSEEVRIGMNPLADDRNGDLDRDGVPNGTEYLMGRSVNHAGAVGDTNGQVRLTLFLPLD